MIKWWIKKNIYEILLFLIATLLFFLNYKRGTWLIGWDNVFPELNFVLNIKRDLFAIWQQYRGLGVVDGMSHSSLIIQDFIRFFLSLFLPIDLIRWVYILGQHFIGGLGILKLFSRLKINRSIAFIGALFYMFNLGSIIQFFLPLEVFIVHFAFLPWIVLFIFDYQEHGQKKNLLLLGIVSLLATPQAHVPTVFIAYSFIIIIILLISLFQYNFKTLKKILVITVTIFITNAFWFLPFFVTNITNSKVVANSKVFQMASNDIFYRNNKYGDFSSVALIKGLPLEFKHLNYKTGQTHFMMQPWLDHIKTHLFYIPAWIFFSLTILGLFYSLKSKNKYYLPLAGIFLFSFFMLATDEPGVNIFSNFLRKNIPLFNIVFRFTFTKFSVIYAFSYSALLTISLNLIFKLIKNITGKILLFTIIFFLIFAYSLPAFKGHFFYENLAVKIPKEYFQVFNFFDKQNHNERVAILPIPWYWAWSQPKWGTINSGFIWYGIPQSITDLAFIPWGKQNENFYWELDKAISSKNSFFLRKVLGKYDINWVYLDKNIINTASKKTTFEDYEELLSKTKGIRLVTKFNLINIYKVDNKKLDNFITIKSHLKSIAPPYQHNDIDQAYIDYGDYITDKNPEVYYPFRSLFSGKSPKDIEFTISEDNNNLYLKSTIPKEMLSWRLHLSDSFNQEFVVYDQENNLKKYEPKTSINKNILTVTIPKGITKVYQSKNNQSFLRQENNACPKNPSGIALLQKSENVLTLTSKGSDNCIKIYLPTLSLRYGYLFNIKTKNDNKRGFFINLTNLTSKKNDLEIYLDNDGKEHNYFLISSPRGYYDLGYTIYFNNRSEGREIVFNTLKEVNVYQIPYFYLKNLKLIKPEPIKKDKLLSLKSFKAKQKNIAFYEIKLDGIFNEDFIAYLSQSYNPGWQAYFVEKDNFLTRLLPFIFGKKIKNHVLVNNWANGWRISKELIKNGQSSLKIVILFWPQYLQFLGFGLILVTLLRILLIKES